MSYRKLTYESPFLIKRFSHRSRFDKYFKFVRKISKQKRNASVLDYGAGDGYMFVHFVQRGLQGPSLHAYEPIDEQFQQLKALLTQEQLNAECIQQLRGEKYDIVICAEVLEHFTSRDLLVHLETIRESLKDNGYLLISVPLEVGLAGAAKNAARMLLGQAHSGQTGSRLWKSFLGRPFFRGSQSYISSHLGFSHLRLEYLILESDFEICRRYFGPFPFLGGLLNSQVYFECRPRM